IARKEDVLNQNIAGVKFLMEKKKVEIFKVVLRIVSKTQIKITTNKGKAETIEAKQTVIATVSKPDSLASITVDKER
ncbi:dihydrolipoyl dehydrogenase, partial [Capnocytophaga ochracea]|nr:dihydrolipoyl dehydrogenase [Capnocytophaga ochracea]